MAKHHEEMMHKRLQGIIQKRREKAVAVVAPASEPAPETTTVQTAVLSPDYQINSSRKAKKKGK